MLTFFAATSHLPKNHVAALGVLHVCLDLIKAFSDMGLDTLCIKRFSRQKSGLFLMLAPVISLKMLGFLFGSVVAFLLFSNSLAPIGIKTVCCAFATIITCSLNGIFVAYCQAQRQIAKTLGHSIFLYTVPTIAAILCWKFKFDVSWVYIIIALAEVLILILNFHKFIWGNKLIILRPLAIHWKIAKATFPIAITVLIGVVYQRVDFFAVNVFLTTTDSANYAILQRLTEPAIFLLSAAAVTTYARLSVEKMCRKDLYNKTKTIALIAGSIGLSTSIIINVVAYLLGFRVLLDATTASVMMMVGIGIKAVALSLTSLVQSQISFWIVTISSSIVLLLQVVLSVIVVPRFGLDGAAMLQGICDIVNSVIQFWAIKKYCGI